MIHIRKSSVMDSTTETTFGKRYISISKTLLIIILIFFVGCIIATGLLVYHLSSNCSNYGESTVIVNMDKLNSNNNNDNNNKDISTMSTLLEGTTTLQYDDEELMATATTTAETPKNEIVNLRLPSSIHPHSYNIKLIPFIREGNFSFHGEVTILINVTITSHNITLHVDDLNIQEVTVTNLSEESLSIKNIENDTLRQFLIIYLETPVLADMQYYINIKYKGILNDLLQGFYRSSYKVGNQTRWIAVTQFQATDARKAFPCFDEPALKARFRISLARLKNMTSVSNMPISGPPEPFGNDLPDYVWDHYEESVPMSTYLVAFLISDFESISDGSFSIWARHSAISQAKYSLEIGPKVLKFYEEFFGINYPLPKVDMVGLPDFSAGAMENWGLITYRESMLLYEKDVSSKRALQGINHVIAHELAHQWFGNLVTPTWWTDLWLNEGFATYVESLGADSVNPSLKELDQFVVNELHGAFAMDALKSSHKISTVVNNPDEINDIFDSISYAKGASILRMMQHFLSMTVFRRGLHNYLSSKMYGSADQDDLWRTLTKQSHEDKVLSENMTIKEIMDTWTLQTGFPILTVKRNYDNSVVNFTQERFYVDRSNPSVENPLWWIPITYSDNRYVLKSVWMKPESKMSIEDPHISRNSWLLVNINATGYYRVNYDKKNWEMITQQLQTPKGHLLFDPKNRAQLIDDAMNLASSGYLDYSIALNITKYLKQEREYIPWNSAFDNFYYIHHMLLRTANFEKYKKYILHLIKDFYDELGFHERENESPLVSYSRILIYHLACNLGLRDCVINAIQQFENWVNSPNPDKFNAIQEDMRSIVYCTSIRVGDQEQWEFAWRRFLNANVGTERDILLNSLGCSRETWILSRYLEWAITESSGIRKQDAAQVFSSVASNPVGQDLVYRYVKNNWDRIKKYLGTSSMALNSILTSATHKINTPTDVEDLKQFVTSKKDILGITERAMQHVIETAEANVQWMNRNYKAISNWLNQV